MIRKIMARLRPAGRASTGAQGERIAAHALKRSGFRILARNLRSGWDEADLLALDPDGRTLVVVEVKTRSSADASPFDQMTPAKQRKLNRLAAHLQKQRRFRDRGFRFDVVAVVLGEGEPQVTHLRGAFESRY